MNDPNLRDARILIIDDQEANIQLLEGLLQQGGYTRWRSLRDPRRSAEVRGEFQPDLIMLDLVMPHLDGFGVLELLRPCLAKQPYLPILVLTADISPESKRRALAAGAKDFLSKPLDAIEVLLRVKNLLETRFLYLQLQHRADERIREQAALIDQANDAILVCDLDDRITFWNRGAEALYGWTAADVTGRSAAEVLFRVRSPSPPRGGEGEKNPPSPPRGGEGRGEGELAEANRTVMATSKWTGELVQTTEDGRDLIVASRWTLLHDAEGRPKSKLVINTDITEKKKTEDKLLRAQRMENIGRLAGGIAHDLNNILSPLTMGVGLLEPNCTNPDDQALLTAMKASLQRGADLVRQILTFSRGLDGERHYVQLGALVGELTQLFQQTFPRSITIRTAVPEGLWLVHADATQMHQVLTNLCVNARDAMPHGGQLRIAAANRPLDGPAAQAQGLAPGKYVLLEVEDTGTGIPAEIREKIFEPFYTTKEVGKGTGLGLYTTQGIVRNHGGRIRVQSEVGKGTRFAIYLPAVEAAEAEPAEPERRELPYGKGELILVVDDEAALLQMAKVTLTTAGYRVLTAHDGAEAVALFARQPQDIQLVLTDLVMPVLGGAATIDALLQLNPDVRIIVLSGLLPRADTSPAAGAGVKASLPKPYTVETLLSTVRSVLDS